MIEVIATDEFEAWYLGLDDADQEVVYERVEQLRRLGVALKRPLSGDIKGTKLAMRELIMQSGGKPLRGFYIFDVTREAVLLCGGDKSGNPRFYKEMIAKAEKIWKQYLKEHGR